MTPMPMSKEPPVAAPMRDDAGALAHELNNLLAVIGGHADAVEPALAPGGADHASIRAIQRAVAAAAAVTARVHRLGHAVTASARGVDVQPIVERAVAEVAGRFGPHLNVVVHPPSRLWSASVTPTLIDQVLRHVLARAAEVTPHGAVLNVRCMNVELGTTAWRSTPPRLPAEASKRQRERHVRIELSGPTAPADAAAVPAEAPAAAPDCEVLLEALAGAGGRLAVEGDGATVTTWALLLPSDGVEPRRPAAVAARAATVVVLDGDDTRRGLVLTVLQRQGYTVRAAGSYGEAARWANEGGVDLVLADGRLTGAEPMALSGGAARLLRMAPAGETASPPVLTSPFTAAELLAGVEAALTVERPVSRPRVVPYHRVAAMPSEEIA